MGRIHEIASLVQNGKNLLEMQESTCLTIPSILDYLRRACGYGFISRSDVYFSIPRRYRALFYVYETYHNQPLYKQLRALSGGDQQDDISSQDKRLLDEIVAEITEIFNVPICEIPFNRWNQDLYKAYREFSNQNSLRADLYTNIASLEVQFNTFLRSVLTEHFGEGEGGWWRQGMNW